MWAYLKYAVLSVAVGVFAAGTGALSWWASESILLGIGIGAALFVAFIIAAAAGFIFLHLTRRNASDMVVPATRLINTDPSIAALKPRKELVQSDSPGASPGKQPARKPMALVTKSLRWSAFSESALEVLGQSEIDLVGKSIYHRVHPRDIPLLEDAISQTSKLSKPQRCVCRIIPQNTAWSIDLRDDSDALADTSVLPLFPPQDCLYVQFTMRSRRSRPGLIVRFADVTAFCRPRDMELLAVRKELRVVREQSLAATLDLDRLKLSYRELYQYAPVMYFSVDTESRLVTFNETLLETLGYERKDLHNQSYTVLLSPDARKNYVAIAQNLPSQEGEIETRWCKKDGTVIDVWLHTTPVYDEDGRFVRSRNAALDLTEKIRLASEAKLRSDQLEQTNQRLRGINNELEAFTHVVSHDLKEPLRTLQAYSQLLAEEHGARLGADGFQYVNYMVRASKRLGTLIDELLKLSQAGRITRERQNFNLIEVVATVRQDLVDLIQRKQAAILTEGSLPDLVGDTARVTQLIANLVANGLKYNKNASPKVIIGAVGAATDPGFATLFVRDNGIGIAPVFHKQIFGIFRRLHKEDEYEGTGAGLAICKKIVEGHGGRIWLESAPGHGATFFFTLPLATTRKVKPMKAPKLPPHENGSRITPRQDRLDVQASRSSMPRIVLVDDQTDVGMIIQTLGKRDGLSIAWFSTAEDALASLQTHGADLLLLDINLPGMSGIELCRRLRKLKHLAKARVAMFTPEQDADELQKLRAAGADFFLTKDLLCHPARWQHKIQELLEQFHAAVEK